MEEIHSATSDGTLVGLVSLERYLEAGGKPYKGMKDDDNPIAVILK